jgi:protoporphyrinogen oxidase
VVLGAGVSGLKSSLYLLEKGYDVEILEKLDDAGGMARSHELNGFVFDHGPHGFFSSEEWLVDEFKRLVGGEEGYHWLTKWSQIHYRSEYFNYPLKLVDLVSKMSPFKLVSAFLWYLGARARLFVTRRPATNAQEYLLDQYGRVLYREFFGPYTKKVWGIEPTELDADFTRDRVPELHLWDVLRKLFTDPLKEQLRARLTPSGRVATHDLHTFY